MRNTWLLAAACMAMASASADVVHFKSGDRLTGKIGTVADGKMTFVSKVAGKLTLDMADIKTFATDAPVELALADGSVVLQQVAAAGEGQVTVRPGEAAPPQTIDLAAVAKINPEKPHWTGAVVAGALVARGNTKSETASVSADAARRTDDDRIALGGGYFFANQRDNTTRESSTSEDNWFLKGKYDYFFSEKFYGYANIKYEKDRIADLDMRLAPGAGLGRQWIEKPDCNFFTEGGFSWVYERYTDPDESRTYMAARLAYHLDKAFNSHVKGFHSMELLPSLEDIEAFLVNTDVGLRAAMTERMFIEAKAQLTYNAQPADEREKEDLRYVLGVGVAF